MYSSKVDAGLAERGCEHLATNTTEKMAIWTSDAALCPATAQVFEIETRAI